MSAMKSIFVLFGLLLAIVASPMAQADCGGGGNNNGCGIDVAVFNELLNYYCDGYTKVTQSGALEIAKLAATRIIDVPSFKTAFYKTCDYNFSKSIAQDVKNQTVNFDVFARLYRYYCDGYTKILQDGARDIARLAASKTIDVGGFESIFYKTCDYNFASSSAQLIKSERFDLSTFKEFFRYYCHGYTKILQDGASELAQLVAKKAININDFKTAFYKTCDYNLAKQIGCAGKLSTLVKDAQPGGARTATSDDDVLTKNASTKSPGKIAILDGGLKTNRVD